MSRWYSDERSGVDWRKTGENLIILAPMFVAAGFDNILACFLYLAGLVIGSVLWVGWGHDDEEVHQEPTVQRQAAADQSRGDRVGLISSTQVPGEGGSL